MITGMVMSMLPPISSPANPEIRRLQRLVRAGERLAQGAFLVEGARIIDGFLDAGWQPRQILLRDDVEVALWPVEVQRRVPARVIDKLSSHRSPSGYVAEFALPAAGLIDPPAGGLICDGVADPGNLGTLIRSAAAFGIGQLVLVGGADPYAPKVVQASAGALARITVIRLASVEDVPALAPLVGLVVSGGIAPADLPPWPCWLVVGSEAHGISSELRARCSDLLTLPMPGETESLNAGVAGSLACYLIRGL
jgi:TrmH family RNA methyltransferase